MKWRLYLTETAVILSDSDLSDDKIAQIDSALFHSIGDHYFSYVVNSHVFPIEIQKKIKGNIRSLELDWQPIYDKDEMIERIMVIIRDVTDINKLKAETALKDKQLQVLSQLLNCGEHKSVKFINSSEQLLKRATSSLKSNHETTQEKKSSIYRCLHTIKGNSRTYSFSFLADQAHVCETKLNEVDLADKEDSEDLKSDLEKLETLLDEHRTIYQEKIKREGEDNYDHDFILAIYDAIKKADQEKDVIKSKKTVTEIKEYVQNMIALSIEEITGDLQISVKEIASQLNKEVPKVIVEDLHYKVKPDYESLIKNILVHCFRNSLDHGIESKQERLEKGKSAEGKIFVKAIRVKDYLKISIEDDGRGLNLKTLESKGLENELITTGANDQEIAKLIFHSGMSTANSITDISGRGVGMEAVNSFIKEHSGHMTIEFTDKKIDGLRPFRLLITLPNHLFITNLVNISKPAVVA